MPRPPDHPGVLSTQARAAVRTNKVERRPAGDGGIQFNSGTYGTLNIGDYLQVEARGPGVGSAWGAAIEIIASAADNPAGGVYIADGGVGGLTLREYGAGQLFLVAESPSLGIELQNNSTSSDINIHSTAADRSVFIVGNPTGGVFLSSHSGTVTTPGPSKGIAMVAEPSSGGTHATIQAGVSGTDWFSVFDNNGFSSPIERFQFIANGQCRMLSLPTSSAGLPAGSLWNSAGTVKIV